MSPASFEVMNNVGPHNHNPEFPEQDFSESNLSESHDGGAMDPAGNGNGNSDQYVTKPGQHDVLLGRGGGTNNHSGNVRFRKLVNEHKMRYLACSKVDKPKVAREVVQLWRKMDPPGRFLARKDDSKRGPGSVKAADTIWFEVGDKKAREKASQCLRERTPDVLPYIKQLREQQDAITEQGVSMVQQQLQMQAAAQQDFGGHYGGGHHLQQQQHHMHPGHPHHHQPQSHHHHHHHMQQQQQQSHHPHHPNNGMHNMHFGGGNGTNGGSNGVGGLGAGFPPRRTSMPDSRGGMGSMSQRSGGNMMNGGSSNNNGGRQRSMPGGGAFRNGRDEFYGADDGFANGNGAGPQGDLSEMEYQQNMMLMQQQLEIQQMQLERLRNERAQQRTPGSGGGGGLNNNNSQHSGYAGNDVAPSQPMRRGGGGSNNYDSNGNPQQFFEQDPLMNMPMSQPERRPGVPPGGRPNSPPRGADAGAGANNPNNGKRARDATIPDHAGSSMPEPQQVAGMESGELTLEEYRQQLEDYITNQEEHGTRGAPAAGGAMHGGAGSSNPNGIDDEDLEDDWEKEREKTLADERKRGVERNMSGMSMMSTKSSKSNVSMVSGFSGLSDLISRDQDSKMELQRTLSSNLSLMSDMTDLSHNIDNLSIYDDDNGGQVEVH